MMWIADPDRTHLLGFEKGWPDLERKAMPMPKGRGKAWIEYFHLGQGIDSFKSHLEFGPDEEAHMLPVGELRGALSEPIFWLTFLTEGNGTLVDRKTGIEFPLGGGGACFRRVDRFDELAKYDTRKSVCQIDITILDSAMQTLLGKGYCDRLLSALHLEYISSYQVHPLPVRIIELMKTLLPDNLEGRIRTLHSQGKALEILSSLANHFNPDRSCPQPRRCDEVLPLLREELLACEGDVPFLSELSEKYGLPARQLNEEFKQRYGSTIYAFMINQRLDHAFDIVRDCRQPLKLIAANLGYSNVNNFLAAFKRRHGISPGKLQKGELPTSRGEAGLFRGVVPDSAPEASGSR